MVFIVLGTLILSLLAYVYIQVPAIPLKKKTFSYSCLLHPLETNARAAAWMCPATVDGAFLVK